MYPLCRFRPWLPTGCPFCGQSYPYDGVPRPFFGTEWPCRHSGLPSRMSPARSLAQGEAHAASAPHGLGNLRALPFSEGCAAAVSATLPLSPIHPKTDQSSEAAPGLLGPSPLLPGAGVRASRSLARSMEFFHGKMHTLPLEPSHDAGSVPQRSRSNCWLRSAP